MLCHLQNMIYTDETTELTAIASIPAMQRRRLSALAKVVLHTAKSVLAEQAVDYIVWSSCHGDEATTASIISDIATGQTPSPTQFSVSVHNAISGLYSILYQDDTPAVSISSTPSQCWQDAVIDAYTYLYAQQKNTALIVYYDAPLPALYQTGDTVSVEHLHAIGALLSINDTPNLRLTRSNTSIKDVSAPYQSDAFYRFWQGDSSHLDGVGWVFEKC